MQKKIAKSTEKRRIKIYICALLAACALLTSCTPQQPSSGYPSDIPQSADAHETSSEEERGGTDESEETEQAVRHGETETAVETLIGSAETQDPETENARESEETPPIPPVSSSDNTTATTSVSQFVTGSSSEVKPDPKPPAEVVIPDVRTVSSPGTNVFKAENAVVDYSNASKGYISARYTGKSAKAQLRLICSGKTYTHPLPVDGTTVYLPLSCGSGTYQVEFYEHVEGVNYAKPIDESFKATISDDTGVFLYPNMYVDFVKSSACVKKAAELCAGLSSPIDKIGAIFTYVADTISYDNQLAATVQSGYVPNPDKTLSKKTGICFDYAALFAAMARSQNIPTRLVIGYASPDIYHAWNEVYTPETGWITAELYLKQKGYNLVDATFYSGASNKEQIAKYISDQSNYSAVYYY